AGVRLLRVAAGRDRTPAGGLVRPLHAAADAAQPERAQRVALLRVRAVDGAELGDPQLVRHLTTSPWPPVPTRRPPWPARHPVLAPARRPACHPRRRRLARPCPGPPGRSARGALPPRAGCAASGAR